MFLDNFPLHCIPEHSLARINKLSPTSARISYRPTATQQREGGADGIAGKFIVQYDVERALDGGEIYVSLEFIKKLTHKIICNTHM